MRDGRVVIVSQCHEWIGTLDAEFAQTPLRLEIAPAIRPADLRRPSLRFCTGVVFSERDLKVDLLETCAHLRARDQEMTLLAILADRNASRERKLLEVGVDDVVAPPVCPKVVAARLWARLKQRGWDWQSGHPVDLGGTLIDFANLQLLRKGHFYHLTKNEAHLLQYFLAHPNRVISRQEVCARLWGDAVIDPEGRNLDMHISKLRKLLEDDPKRPRLILTVRGVGYRLALPPGHPAASTAINGYEEDGSSGSKATVAPPA